MYTKAGSKPIAKPFLPTLTLVMVFILTIGSEFRTDADCPGRSLQTFNSTFLLMLIQGPQCLPGYSWVHRELEPITVGVVWCY